MTRLLILLLCCFSLFQYSNNNAVDAQLIQNLFTNQPCRYLPTTACYAENFDDTKDGSLDGDLFDDLKEGDWNVKVLLESHQFSFVDHLSINNSNFLLRIHQKRWKRFLFRF